jgi:hypothetical protein
VVALCGKHSVAVQKHKRQRQKLYQFLDCHGRQSALAMTTTATTNGNNKMENDKRQFRNSDPSPCPLPQGARERHDKDKSFISFWIATGDKAPSQ